VHYKPPLVQFASRESGSSISRISSSAGSSGGAHRGSAARRYLRLTPIGRISADHSRSEQGPRHLGRGSTPGRCLKLELPSSRRSRASPRDAPPPPQRHQQHRSLLQDAAAAPIRRLAGVRRFSATMRPWLIIRHGYRLVCVQTICVESKMVCC